MDIFLAQENIILALVIIVTFALAWLANRWLASRREKQLVSELTDELAFLERQRDSAHKISMELADTHKKLVGEHLEAEWTIHSLKSDLKVRDERIKQLLVTANSERSAVKAKTDIWSVDETHIL